jgi:hypothetical protein
MRQDLAVPIHGQFHLRLAEQRLSLPIRQAAQI